MEVPPAYVETSKEIPRTQISYFSKNYENRLRLDSVKFQQLKIKLQQNDQLQLKNKKE